MWDHLKGGEKAWYGDYDHVTVNEEEIRTRKYMRNVKKRLEPRKRGREQKFEEA